MGYDASFRSKRLKKFLFLHIYNSEHIHQVKTQILEDTRLQTISLVEIRT